MATARTRPHRPADRQLLLGTITLLVVVALAVLAAVSTNGLPFVPRYHLRAVLPTGAPAIRVGTDVRSAGRHVGVVSDVRRSGLRQDVGLRLDIHPAGRDASVTLRLKSPAGGRFLDVDLGNTHTGTLRDGATVDPARVHYTEDFPTIVSDFSKHALDNSKHGIQLTGGGLLGRGGDLNRAFAGAGTTLRRTTSLIDAFSPGQDLPALTRGTGDLTSALQGRSSGDIAGFVSANADLLNAFADPRARLGATLAAVPPAEQAAAQVLPQTDAVLRDTTTLAERLRPTVGALRGTLPATLRLLRTGPTLRDTIAGLTKVTAPALRAAAPVLRRLGPTMALVAASMPPTATLTAYLSRFKEETTGAVAAYYGGSFYHAPFGAAAGLPAVPAMLIVSCAKGVGAIDPKPGEYMHEHSEKPCQ